MKTQTTTLLTKAFSYVTVIFIATSCGQSGAPDASPDDQAVLASSGFYSGESAPGMEKVIAGNDPGYISGGSTSSSTNDTGYIAPPGSTSAATGTTGTSSGSTTGSAGSSSSSSTPATGTTSSSTSSSTPTTGTSSATSSSGTSSTSSVGTGNDPGNIAAPTTGTGNDTGNIGGAAGAGTVVGSGTGTSSTSGTAISSSGSTPSTGSGSAVGSGSASGATAGNTTGSSTPSSTSSSTASNDTGNIGTGAAAGAGSGSTTGSSSPSSGSAPATTGSSTTSSGAAGSGVAAGTGAATGSTASSGSTPSGSSSSSPTNDTGNIGTGTTVASNGSGTSGTSGSSSAPSSGGSSTSSGSTPSGSGSGSSASSGPNPATGASSSGSAPSPSPSGSSGSAAPSSSGSGTTGTTSGNSSSGSTVSSSPSQGTSSSSSGRGSSGSQPSGSNGAGSATSNPSGGLAGLINQIIQNIQNYLNKNSGSQSSTTVASNGGSSSSGSGGSSAGNPNSGSSGSTSSNSGSGSGTTSRGSSSGGSSSSSSGSGSSGSASGNSTNSSSPSITVTLDRACSAERSQIPYPNFIFFEEAKHPILSIEASYPQTSSNQMMGCSQPAGTQYASVGFNPPASATSGNSGWVDVLIAKVDLSNVNLLNGPFQTQVQLGLAQLQAQLGSNMNNVVLTASVCDDTLGNGECSTENSVDVLSVGSDSFSPTHVPSNITLDVWSGRGFSITSDPNLCEVQYSPLVMDLTGQGVHLTNPEDGVYFDLNGTGTDIRTAWPQSNNVAFLVRDVNGNGEIDSGAELFGTATKMPDGSLATNGFEALKALDSNGDGMITSADAAWSQLRLWIDFNHDGVAEPGELSTLKNAGIQSISLNYVYQPETDQYGNTSRYRSVFHRWIHGKSVPLLIVDVWFETLKSY